MKVYTRLKKGSGIVKQIVLVIQRVINLPGGVFVF